MLAGFPANRPATCVPRVAPPLGGRARAWFLPDHYDQLTRPDEPYVQRLSIAAWFLTSVTTTARKLRALSSFVH